MPPKRPIGGSGDAGAAEAPEHGVNMEIEVSVAADEVENEAAKKRRRVEKELQATPTGLDFINNLPDDMLIVIISLLPIKYRARIAALSRQWCPLWLLTPVDLLDARKLCHGYRQSLDASPRSSAVTMAQSEALSWVSFVPMARTEPSLTSSAPSFMGEHK